MPPKVQPRELQVYPIPPPHPNNMYMYIMISCPYTCTQVQNLLWKSECFRSLGNELTDDYICYPSSCELTAVHYSYSDAAPHSQVMNEV